VSAPVDRLILCRLEPGAGAERAAEAVLRALGLGDEALDLRCRWHGPTWFTVRAASVEASVLASLEGLPGVERVLWLGSEDRLATRAGLSSVALPSGHRIGGGGLTVIAGPCSVEGEEQVLRAAECVAAAGAQALRGGVFKPRTSPYAFAGLGERGLEYLASARERTGLPVVTEALEPAQLDVVARYADVIQIGSRNMACFPLLFHAGAHPSGLPVLLKRGLGATIDELLAAAEYVLLGRLFAGHEEPGLILCERGIRTFETSTRFTLDVGAFPVIRQRSPLPVLGDPSHAAGARALVPALARAAVAAGADGLLIEVHPDPDSAWCDGKQSLTPATFRVLMGDLHRIAGIEPVTAGAAPLAGWQA